MTNVLLPWYRYGTNAMPRRTVTVLIPCRNEQEALPELMRRLDRLRAAAEREAEERPVAYAFMFVDDGSTDRSRSLIERYAHEHSADVQYVFLSRNFGKEKAMLAGIDKADCDALVIIDADLQDPPELIPDMVDLWLQGYEDVYARRRSRAGETWLKRATAHAYYRVLGKMSDCAIQPDTGDFRLLDRKCLDALRTMRESERNSKALFSWIGFNKIEFLYDRDPRVAGTTKWSYRKLVRLALDGITSLTTMPLHLAAWAGALVTCGGLAYAAYTLACALASGRPVPQSALLMVCVLVVGGMQLIGLGIIGEYLGRMFVESKHRPDYLVEDERLSPALAARESCAGIADAAWGGAMNAVQQGRSVHVA